MAIVINGSGTVTGLAVGGLPDGTVDAGTLATNSVDSAELIDGSIDSSHLASGVGGVAGISSSADATAMTIDSGERIGIGNTVAGTMNGVNSSILTIGTGSGHSGMTVYTGSTNEGTINFADDTSGSGTYKGMVRYDHNTNALTLHSNATEAIKIDSTGAVTMPKQPAFSVGMAGHQSAIALYGERKAEFDSERFDQNADFNTTTHEFTAPVTGRYQLSFVCYLEPMQGDANFYGFHINTSNKSHFYYDLGRGDNHDHSGGGAMSVLADMDAGDTAFCAIYQHAGAASTKIMSHSTFSGYLAC